MMVGSRVLHVLLPVEGGVRRRLGCGSWTCLVGVGRVPYPSGGVNARVSAVLIVLRVSAVLIVLPEWRDTNVVGRGTGDGAETCW